MRDEEIQPMDVGQKTWGEDRMRGVLKPRLAQPRHRHPSQHQSRPRIRHRFPISRTARAGTPAGRRATRQKTSTSAPSSPAPGPSFNTSSSTPKPPFSLHLLAHPPLRMQKHTREPAIYIHESPCDKRRRIYRPPTLLRLPPFRANTRLRHA